MQIRSFNSQTQAGASSDRQTGVKKYKRASKVLMCFKFLMPQEEIREREEKTGKEKPQGDAIKYLKFKSESPLLLC